MYSHSLMGKNDYFRLNATNLSLSIVNPLDVLRQRLLLEIARRQMKENSRQKMSCFSSNITNLPSEER
ncbi:hypothetical protein DOY81_008886 [Sarcophaga bullata]|nr:hypothetical protein DOY81_008886 [Sarcophaga bullata]